ncbi:hypothetical protein EK0264_09020 [Epidermidibacterium keratini]|uniref:Uncharacterized protein n=1 Tax=Epidermidibacterium keratini TaxID=1891644 RepID=A0A7L4YMU9_9ACTN|nr:hypothetical protein [Epidermidibacterium keratini]QHC00408.1 hypothetical protein EK0264_09020 [Epidermidibacterium keratini]
MTARFVLYADPQRLDSQVRFVRRATFIAAGIAVWIVVAGVPVALLTTPLLLIGFGFCALVAAGFALYFARNWRALRGQHGPPVVAAVSDTGVQFSGEQPINFADLAAIRRQFVPPYARPVHSAGDVAGNVAVARIEAQRPELSTAHHLLRLEFRSGAQSERRIGPASTPHDVARFLDALARAAQRADVAVSLDQSSPPAGPR